jgi:putative Mg2+ transporter-C (MgtC) family protein
MEALKAMSWPAALDAQHTVTHEVEIVIRLLLAAAVGAAIGIEREMKDRPAGLRTHMLTALASAVFTILTFEIYQASKSTSDPIRIIEAVTAGVAFLAAGAIIQGRAGVQGLTTGAGMWMAGALGVACHPGRAQAPGEGAVRRGWSCRGIRAQTIFLATAALKRFGNRLPCKVLRARHRFALVVNDDQ